MPKPTSVPIVPRRRAPAARAQVRAGLTVPGRFDHRYPGPEEEIEPVNEVEFAVEYFVLVICLAASVCAFAVLVLMPICGQIFAAT
jgi:hypothetical protein